MSYPPPHGQPPAGQQPPAWGSAPPPGPTHGWPPGPPRPPSSATRGLVIAVAGLAVVLLGSAGAVVMLGGDDSSEERDAYVEAMTAVTAESGMGTGTESGCLAEGAVDTLGVDALREVVSPEELMADPSKGLGSHGMEFTDAQAEGLFGVVEDCVGAREVFRRGMSDEDEAVVECVDTAVDDDLLRRMFTASWVDGDDYLETNPDLAEELAETVAHCDSD